MSQVLNVVKLFVTPGETKYIFNKTHDFGTFFAVGKSCDKETMKKLRKEREIYKDIILGDYVENFYNLPYKFETIFDGRINIVPFSTC